MRKLRNPPTIDQGSPDYTKRPPLKLTECEVPPGMRDGFPPGIPIRAFTLGECTVILTRNLGRHHMSVAHPRRYPNWDEIAEATHRIVPRVWMALHVPPKNCYVNINKNCFQLVETAALPREL